MTVVTRFAPSPTGFLHIGSARTALFNWLYARHHRGRFLLRIEDTDRARSTSEAVAAILDGLAWLGLEWDDEPLYQSTRVERHAAVARGLLEEEKAYRCFCTPEELAEMREQAKAEGRSMRYDGRWRDRNPSEAPAGVAPVIRFKAPREGETVIEDVVQGEVRIANEQLDDMVLLRADGTPTYMLAVVVDDHDMGVTNVIRGDEHLVNAARQSQLFQALGWAVPSFAHIPLIHGPDGGRLSKRHGALGLETYREMGFLPEAMRNYLLRLGWGHEDHEVISTEQAIAWFDLDGVGRAAARFDLDKLSALNAHYLRQADAERLAGLVTGQLEVRLGRALDDDERVRLNRGMPGLKQRAKTIQELADNASFYIAKRPLTPDDKAAAFLDTGGREVVARVAAELAAVDDWSPEALERVVRRRADKEGVRLVKIAQPLRAALTGSTVSPGIFEVMAALGRDETLARLKDVQS